MIKPGIQYTLVDGSLVEAHEMQADRVHVRVTYVDSLDNPEIPVGSDKPVPYEEFVAIYQGTHSEGLT